MDVKHSPKAYEMGRELRFVDGRQGFQNIAIENANAQAIVSPYAGQVLSYRPANEPEDMLFLSPSAHYQAGRPIRGGIPVCWPWFGDDPEGLGRPAHGFVRNRQWAVTGSQSLPGGVTKVIMELVDTEETRTIWPHPFQLAIAITVGDSLTVELATRNTGTGELLISQALHAYLWVGDISQVRVLGLEGGEYLDKVDGFAKKAQTGAVTVNGEVDRIYAHPPGELVVDDTSLDRTIRIECAGCSNAVVWNPWAKKAAALPDLGDDDYNKMICVEAANTGSNAVKVPAGGEYRISAQYSVRR